VAYKVVLEKKFKARQGLKSPIRNAQSLPSLQPPDGYDLSLRVGIAFADRQLGERGWFIDTDSVESELDKIAAHLAAGTWTDLFDFRPTFEHVTRWAHQQLQPLIPQLDYVEIHNRTLGVSTKYTGDN